MSKRSQIDPEQERLAIIQAAKLFVGHEEPESDEEAAIIEETRRELPRADRAELLALARQLAKQK